MLSHVITFLYLPYLQSLCLISLPPGFFPLAFDRLPLSLASPHPQGQALHPLPPLQQQIPSRQLLPQSCQTSTVDTTRNKVTYEAVTCQLPEDHKRIFTTGIKPSSPHSATDSTFCPAWRKGMSNSQGSLQQAHASHGSVPLHCLWLVLFCVS